MNNSVYLKKYVENHPDNKMAWYLLGKEYEAAGQEGKANYCYNQASGVYEAFEASKVPADLWKEYQTKLLQESKRKEKQSRLARRIGVLLILLMLIWIPLSYAPGQTSDGSDTVIADTTGKKEVQSDSGASSGKTKPTFTAREYSGNNGMKYAADLLGGNRSDEQSQTVVMGMKRSGNWLLWSKNLPVVYGIQQDSDSGETTIQSYDPIDCDCTPPDPSKLQKEGEKWAVRQESLAVLSSAIRHYKEKNGKWPSSLKELTKPFPGNWLAGTDTIMKDNFIPLLSQLQKNQPDNETEVSAHNGNTTTAKPSLQEAEPYFTLPLEVLVDKTTHRLAVVSGSVIVRSYKVGLGGEDTPEGKYVISDKVVNPNGHSDGEFGSRGMQLSDTNYAIHGTNEPDSVGKDQSLGCIRMLKEDVEELFDLLPKGTKVTIGKGIVPSLEVVPKSRFTLGNRQSQTNPDRTYHWLN
ncbi:Lipoprotein-anchoring transpeptidase ErfK/SrfK [Fontibacillus panacisegetis]|uniref:Lipoprotein-anchoring transpeptidase ErfK/SrfK n=1 Tax=Fontibacillus panacisegetis TaxID=670482 RepID=A0A1G7MVK8_9BACL|nr:L,D-transpeptidase family protein [Fontibacillus panacisegetis]SDF65701.1 Lipoprotein-anchoring transpeptidase ErfK/SrfK [Fontibacillus panacisegetis]